MTKFGVWCEVFGGVTGHRAAWLKRDGKIVRFKTRDEADAEAMRLRKRANGNPYLHAQFSYYTKPMDEYVEL